VHAIIQLDERSADEVLLKLLGEPEYEEEAGKGLVRLSRSQPDQGWMAHTAPDYRVMWEARAGRYDSGSDAERSQRYAAAINSRIDAILQEQRASGNPAQFNRRLKAFAPMLARLDGRNSASRILEIMALPLEWDGWHRADALEVLLFSGAALPTEATLNVLNPTIEHIQKYGVYIEQNLSLLKKCLCLLPFVEEPEAGIRRIDGILSSVNIWNYALRELVIALGNSKCDAALPLLRRFATASPTGPSLIASELIEALADLDSDGARQMLLGFVDPARAEPGINPRIDFHDGEKLASSLAGLARREPTIAAQLFRLCEANLPQQNRALLAKVVTRIGMPAAIVASLNLLSDAAAPAIPPDLVRGIESIFVQQRPLYGNVCVNEPVRADEIRERLFGMALNDAPRRKSAFTLLGFIEVWRLDYGRPSTEPRHPNINSNVPWPPLDIVTVH
jgi:hypothetical protein